MGKAVYLYRSACEFFPNESMFYGKLGCALKNQDVPKKYIQLCLISN
jgi:hypothetical protein